jgi:3-oxoacyl-[acyl-carrier protein] reductase
VDERLTDPVLDLGGRTAVVTGGSRGVGRATALLLAQAGASVAVAYRSRSFEADEVVSLIRSRGGRALAHRADLALEEEASRLFQVVEDAWGEVDLFIGNHGIWPPEDVPLAQMSTRQWRETMRVNLDSLFFLTREAARRLPDGGRIVLVSSTAAQRGEAGHGDYAATKGAMVSLVKSLAVELAPRDITVNAVAPGWVDTEMVASALDGPGRTLALQGIPLGRLASAEDVAGPITFLCSKLARHITGEILNVNGGAVRPG